MTTTHRPRINLQRRENRRMEAVRRREAGESAESIAMGVGVGTNASEHEMKRIVLNRKNSLYVGNERAGRSAAILSSLNSTCRRHDIDPQRNLMQLLIVSGTRTAPLTPAGASGGVSTRPAATARAGSAASPGG